MFFCPDFSPDVNSITESRAHLLQVDRQSDSFCSLFSSLCFKKDECDQKVLMVFLMVMSGVELWGGSGQGLSCDGLLSSRRQECVSVFECAVIPAELSLYWGFITDWPCVSFLKDFSTNTVFVCVCLQDWAMGRPTPGSVCTTTSTTRLRRPTRVGWSAARARRTNARTATPPGGTTQAPSSWWRRAAGSTTSTATTGTNTHMFTQTRRPEPTWKCWILDLNRDWGCILNISSSKLKIFTTLERSFHICTYDNLTQQPRRAKTQPLPANKSEIIRHTLFLKVYVYKNTSKLDITHKKWHKLIY